MTDIYAVPGETLTGIANAIRSKTGSDEQMPVSVMAAAIESISGGGDDRVITTGQSSISNRTDGIKIILDHTPVEPVFVMCSLAEPPETIMNLYSHTMYGFYKNGKVLAWCRRSSTSAYDAAISGFALSDYSQHRRILGNEIQLSLYSQSSSYTGIWNWTVVENFDIDLF